MAKVEWTAEIPPKVKDKRPTSDYREQKIAAHTTVKGKGKVARIKKAR